MRKSRMQSDRRVIDIRCWGANKREREKERARYCLSMVRMDFSCGRNQDWDLAVS